MKQTNRRTLDKQFITPFFIISPLHVSTPTRHSQGALTRCLLLAINNEQYNKLSPVPVAERSKA